VLNLGIHSSSSLDIREECVLGVTLVANGLLNTPIEMQPGHARIQLIELARMLPTEMYILFRHNVHPNRKQTRSIVGMQRLRLMRRKIDAI
jgi:hypothetical protein